MKTLRIAGITEESTVDGPGIRYVIFMQGCTHNCSGCHNPQTHDLKGGEEADAMEIFDAICENPLIRGVTFSGGEPLLQIEALLPLARKLHENDYHIMLYSGYTFEEIRSLPHAEDLLENIDLLVDGPFILAQKSETLAFRGSSNQRIINVPFSLLHNQTILSSQFTDPSPSA